MRRIRTTRRTRLATLLTVLLLVFSATPALAAPPARPITVSQNGYRVVIHPDGFRYEIRTADGRLLAPAHAESGLRVHRDGAAEPADAVSTKLVGTGRTAVLAVTMTDDTTVTVRIRAARPGTAQFSLAPLGGPATVDFRTGPAGPAFGLGDTGAQSDTALPGTPCGGKVLPRETAELTGIVRDDMTNEGSCKRFLSTFVIFPKQGLGQVLITERQKRVALTTTENRLGAGGVDRVDGLYYFAGSPKQIYANYQQVRRAEGYPDVQPRPDLFEVGWEAYGALAWDTYQTSVQETLGRFVAENYPLRWAVVGSGFWPGPRGNPVEGTTNSFGMWDDTEEPGRDDGLPNPRYPDVPALREFLKSNDMALLLGARNNFKAMPEDGGNYNTTYDGPATTEALERGYYLTDEDGTPTVATRTQFPAGASYVLDGDNPEAVAWYVKQNAKWGADGVKEDAMLYEPKLYRDGNWNPLNEALAKSGQLVIVRNSAYSVPGDTLRINDTLFGKGEDFHHDPDRMPINLLNFAASGAGNVYPDIVGGTPRSEPTDESYRRYFVRNAMFNALTPSMAFGRGPWVLEYAPFEQAARKAADFHSALHPYIYDAVLDGHATGYPSAMTPLPIAYPNDERTYDLASHDGRRYEWLVGESLLATPVFGRDFDTAQTRDVYLPAGKWIDYETGARFTGPATLDDYPLGVDRVPAFVGGKGVLVTRAEKGLTAKVFPVTRGRSTYEWTDGRATSTIVNANSGWDPRSLKLTDTTTHRTIKFTVDSVTGALTFPIADGHDYRLTGGGRATDTLPVERTAPDQVTGLSHTVEAGVTSLSWKASPGARGYVVVRDGGDCADAVVASTTSATSVAIGAEGSGGEFRVTAYNTVGRAAPSAPHEIPEAENPGPVVVTNEQNTAPCSGPVPYTETGTWSVSALKGFDGSGTRYSSAADATATWQAPVPSGRYTVEVWAPADVRNTTAARYTVAGEEIVVDQLADGGQWRRLGEWDFTDTAAVTLTVSGAGLHRTDAVRFTRIES
ncbi:golvesin C-terminal-like domain-containing protein [Actinophytocola sediminis]